MMKVEFSEPDQYGQVHPIENSKLISAKLDELEEELQRIPSEQKPAYEAATVKCPSLVTPKEKLKFLRCEVFRVKCAAKRLVEYWETRFALFGPQKFHLPLTIDEALRDDHEALSIGYIRISPVKPDKSGRNLLYIDPAQLDSKKYARESLLRALWYFIHVVLEDEETQKKGLIKIANSKYVRFAQLDLKQFELISSSLKGVLPIRTTVIHVCNPPLFFRIVYPIMKAILGENMRKRIILHRGSQNSVLRQLQNYGLHRSKLSSDLGGFVLLDHERWLKDRRLSRL